MKEATEKQRMRIPWDLPSFKKREERLVLERWRMETVWKPLWQLFLAICVVYTVMHVLHIPAPSADSGDPYENISGMGH